MPHRHICIATFAISLLATSKVQAANILLISDALKPGANQMGYFHQDDSLVAFLEGLGHTVDTAGMHQGTGADGGPFREPEPFSTLTTYLSSNPADLIIVSRATAISAYNDAKKEWNELDVPLILMNGFLPRAIVGWQWTTGTSQAELTADTFNVVSPTHSFVNGLDTASPAGEISVYSTDVTFDSLQTSSYVAGAEVVATIDGTPALVDIPAGTVFGGDASLYGTSTKRRVFFAIQNYFDPIESGGTFEDHFTTGATDSGAALLGQVVASVLANPEAEPEDSGGGEDGSGSSATSPEPATFVLLLSALIASVGFRSSPFRHRR